MLESLFGTSVCPADDLSVHALCCLLRLGSMRSYASFFSAERFYVLGERIERLKSSGCMLELIAGVSELIRERQLPVKYVCYIVWTVCSCEVDGVLAEQRPIGAGCGAA